MPPAKSIFTSVTFWGSVISLLAMFQPKLFVALGQDPSTVAQYIQAAVGFGITAWGRLRATQPVTITGAPKMPPPTTDLLGKPAATYIPTAPVDPSIARIQGTQKREDLP